MVFIRGEYSPLILSRGGLTVPINLSSEEILETVNMVLAEKLDIRTITMGINILDCRESNGVKTGKRIFEKILKLASNLVKVGDDIAREYGIPIINKRIALSPVAMAGNGLSSEEMIIIGQYMDKAAQEIGLISSAGFTALVPRALLGRTKPWVDAIPEALASTQKIVFLG